MCSSLLPLFPQTLSVADTDKGEYLLKINNFFDVFVLMIRDMVYFYKSCRAKLSSAITFLEY